MQIMTEKLIAKKENHIGWIIFNNPARHNAVSLEMWHALPIVLEGYVNDPEIRVIIIKGAGEKAFVAGADISQFKEKRSSPEAVAECSGGPRQQGPAGLFEADDSNDTRLLHRWRHRACRRL